MKITKILTLVAVIILTTLFTAVTITVVTMSLMNFKITIVVDDKYALSISEQTPTTSILPGDKFYSDWASEPARATVLEVTKTGDQYQIQSTLTSYPQPIVYSVGTKVWKETINIPILGVIFYPFTSPVGIFLVLFGTTLLLVFYRYRFYRKPEPVPKDSTDNIQLLGDLFLQAPNLTLKQAKQLTS